MNIPTVSPPRKVHDLVHLFEAESSIKTECPVCRSLGGDAAGDNLQIGQGHVRCWADESHGDQLWRELRRNGSTDSTVKPPPRKPKGKPTGKEPKAREMWAAPLQRLGAHPYVVKKRIPEGFASARVVRYEGELLLLLPLQSSEDRRLSRVDCVQSITTDGTKLTWGAMTDPDGAPRFGLHQPGDELAIAESLGTAAAVDRHWPGFALVITCGSGRTSAVARTTKAEVVFADNDESGAGLKAAAAADVEAVYMPPDPGTDFADLSDAQDLEVYRVPEAVLSKYVKVDLFGPARILEDAQAWDGEDLETAGAIIGRAKKASIERHKEILTLTYAQGLVLARIKEWAEHGHWLKLLESWKLDPQVAQRAIRLTKVENVLDFPSVNSALNSIRKPRASSKAKAEAVAEAMVQEVEDLKAEVERWKQAARQEADQQLKDENSQLRTKVKEQANQMAERDRRIAALEADQDADVVQMQAKIRHQAETIERQQEQINTLLDLSHRTTHSDDADRMTPEDAVNRRVLKAWEDLLKGKRGAGERMAQAVETMGREPGATPVQIVQQLEALGIPTDDCDSAEDWEEAAAEHQAASMFPDD